MTLFWIGVSILLVLVVGACWISSEMDLRDWDE